MIRYEQGTLGMRRDIEGAWCSYDEANAEIKRLRENNKQLRLMLGSLLFVTSGKPGFKEDGDLMRDFGMLGLDVIKRARALYEALGDE